MLLTVSEEFAGERIDSFIAEETELSRSAAQKLIESGDILLFGAPVSKKHLPKAGDEIEITLPEAEEYEAVAAQYSLELEKVKGMVPVEEIQTSLKTRAAVKVIVDNAKAVAPKAE